MKTKLAVLSTMIAASLPAAGTELRRAEEPIKGQCLAGAPSATPATVRTYIHNRATTNVLTGIGTGSPNRLLFSQ